MMHGTDEGFVRVRHREFIGDKQMRQGFNSTNLAINPANFKLFPWLSQIAPNFEQWQLLGAVLEYKTTSGEFTAAPTPSLGTVSIATRYNVLSRPFSTKQEVLNHQFAVSTRPSQSVMHPIECAPAQTANQPLYIRLADQDPDLAYDARLYDLGTIQVVSEAGAQVVDYTGGELWITYDILLIKPRLTSASSVLVIDPPEPQDPPPAPEEVHQPQLDVDANNNEEVKELEADVATLQAQMAQVIAQGGDLQDDVVILQSDVQLVEQKNVAQDAELDALEVKDGTQDVQIANNVANINFNSDLIVEQQANAVHLQANTESNRALHPVEPPLPPLPFP